MILCFDIGGSWIKSATAYSADRIEIGARHPTPSDDFDTFAEILKSELAAQPERPECIAIAMTGVVEPDTGIITCANIPCIHRQPLQERLESILNAPVLIANDADCFVLAEAGAGAGRGHRTVFGIILGSGVGGGLVVDGRLVNAGGGFAGEWGHAPVVASWAGNPGIDIPAYPCSCGQRGCVNTIGGARGMETLHDHLHQQHATSKAIVAAWQSGSSQAARTVQVFVDLISSPLALAVNITGASIVPAGGGLARSRELLAEIDHSVRRRILRQFDRPLVVPAECEMEPGLIGAALMGLERSRHG